MATEAEPRPATTSTTLGAFSGIVVHLALRLAGFNRVARALGKLTEQTKRQASHREVLKTMRAVEAGAAWLPFRVACLERTFATALLLVIRRKGVGWCVGFRTPPFTMHAWLTDDQGQAIGEPESTAAYQPLIVLIATIRSIGETP